MKCFRLSGSGSFITRRYLSNHPRFLLASDPALRYNKCNTILKENARMLQKPRFRFAALFVSLMILLPAGIACSADEKPQPLVTKDSYFSEWGFYSGAGYGQTTEGAYVPIFFILHMGMDMKRWIPSLEKHRGKLSLFFEPQFNPSGTPRPNYEFGVGVGLKYAYPVSDVFSVYILGSVGPHYITLNTEDQAQGFIFADTIGGGMSVTISPGSALNFEYRFRHLSNAGLELPNHGIETNIGLIGFTLFY